ncbi:ankyrin repeat domain-containing protein 6-like [Cyprinodon tularosa]|uniref:ankyrin repeat domain-containing protein 6-like n=1 Tax=Cyprinodon tularosa TaxID=77115 RepID=UPI0018E2346A|nr:ankyrin repeat domain-containing protein 6-like [Cyprinodon tularosa]
MAAFCRRNTIGSSDMENLVCTLSSAEEVEDPSVMKDLCRSGDGEAIQFKVSGHQTALHRSAILGNSETMAGLIAGGCALDLQDPLGNTALHEVSWHGFTQCVKLLVKAGADMQVKNKAGNTALHLACQNAHAPTAQLLLLAGSNPEAKNKVGDTCLHVAARYNNLNLLKILLRSQCCLNETNQNGDTALHIAASLNHSKAVQLLLSAGLDVTVRNKAGKTALDKARENQNKKVVLLLSKTPQVRYMRRKTMKRPRLRVPTGPAKDSSCGMEQTDPRSDGKDLNKEDLRSERKHNQVQEDEFWGCGETLQLYTLYRDTEGRVQQTPASCCLCKSLLKKLGDNLKTTEEELRLQIQKVKEELQRQMERVERHNKHQLRVLDMLIQEKAASERRSMICRMDQRAAEERAEALRNQAVLRNELKTWCLSLLEYMNIPVPAEIQYQNLLLPPPSAAESDLESVPLLFSEDSSPTVSRSNLRPRCSEISKSAEQIGNRTYFEMKKDKCVAADQNLNSETSADLPTVSAAPFCNSAALHDNTDSFFKEKPSSGHPRTNPQEEASRPTDDTMVQELLMERPAEPTLIQERKQIHAMEVTRRFFDAVTAQLELWCSRKIMEVEWQSELRSREERTEMLQRITELEEELHRLQTNEEKEDLLK